MINEFEKNNQRSSVSYYYTSFGNSRLFFLLNIGILLLSFILYGIITLGFSNESNPLFSSYATDLFAVPALLAVVNSFLYFTTKRQAIIHSPLSILTVAMVAGIYWEWITPLYTTSTTDFYDLVAYLTGGILYFIVITLAKHIKVRFE